MIRLKKMANSTKTKPKRKIVSFGSNKLNRKKKVPVIKLPMANFVDTDSCCVLIIISILVNIKCLT